MVSPELRLPAASTCAPANPGRWFIGIGVGEYDDAALNLAKALSDVDRMSTWFMRDSRVNHHIALRELASNPTWAQISSQLRNFLSQRASEDVVVIYIACHGEQEAGEAYLFGRDTPRANLAGCALSARQLGLMLGSSKPHNVLVIVDACVAGTIAAAIADATHLAVREHNTRDPYRRYAQAIIASTFGLDPAQDGQFVEAFLRTIANERWTGTVRRWISLEQLIQGLNEELRDTAPGQRVECSHWFNGEIQLIPNPNVGRRRHGGLFDDEEFAAHFDPASRGVSRSETGSFFTGRTVELARARQWLNLPIAVPPESSPMFVITGSPGTGKSALLSRIAVLSQPDLLPPGTDLAELPPETVPRSNALEGVIWCHGKTRRQVIGELARVLQGAASTPNALFGLAEAHGQGKVIAVDALDEVAADEAEAIAREVLAPLVSKSSVRLMIATRKHAVGGAGANLIDELAVPRRELLELSDGHNSLCRDCVGALAPSLAKVAVARPLEIAHVGKRQNVAVERSGRLARDVRCPVAVGRRTDRTPPDDERAKGQRESDCRSSAPLREKRNRRPQADEEACGDPSHPVRPRKPKPQRHRGPGADRRDDQNGYQKPNSRRSDTPSAHVHRPSPVDASRFERPTSDGQDNRACLSPWKADELDSWRATSLTSTPAVRWAQIADSHRRRGERVRSTQIGHTVQVSGLPSSGRIAKIVAPAGFLRRSCGGVTYLVKPPGVSSAH